MIQGGHPEKHSWRPPTTDYSVNKFTSTRFGLKSVIRVSELTGLGKIDSLQLIQKSWGHMNKDINLLTSTVRQYSWGTRYLSWLDQYIFVLEENFIATELEHQGSSGVQDQSKGNRSGSDKASLLKINLYISALIPISSTLRVTQAFRLFCGEGGISCYCSHGLPLNDIKFFNLYIQNSVIDSFTKITNLIGKLLKLSRSL